MHASGMDPEGNKAFVEEYMQAFGTFDPDVFLPYVADDATYMVGATVHQGHQGFLDVAEYGRLLYPRPAEAVNDVIATVAEGDWVSVLLKRTAPTNKVEDYENVYGMFFEVRDGKIQTQVELMDFRVSTDKFDLSVLGR
jgi:ketosteroid isomerase-like protein